MLDALALLRSYADLHDRGVETSDFGPMLALFDADAEMRFVGIPFPPCVGLPAIVDAFRRSPPNDRLVLLDAVASPDGSAEAVYAWRAAPSVAAGTIRIEARGGKIRRLQISAREPGGREEGGRAAAPTGP